MKTFRTHKGNIVSGVELSIAIDKVCDECVANAYAIRKEDTYADHISETQKDEFLERDLNYYEQIRKLAHSDNLGYKVWFLQKLDFILTGESIAILP